MLASAQQREPTSTARWLLLTQRFLRELARVGGHKTVLLKLGCRRSSFPPTLPGSAQKQVNGLGTYPVVRCAEPLSVIAYLWPGAGRLLSTIYHSGVGDLSDSSV